MNNVLFRGFSLKYGKWITGYYVYHQDTTYCFTEDYERCAAEGNDVRHSYIVYDEMTDWGLPNRQKQEEVDSDSVRMFTGIIVNNKQVFEGDIIEVDGGHDQAIRGVVRYGEWVSQTNNTHTVGFYIEWLSGSWKSILRQDLLYWANDDNIRIIGNDFEDNLDDLRT